ELETLVDFRSSGPTIDTTAFPNAPDDYYWTSTQYLTVTDWAWGVTFTFGVSHNSPKSDTYTVRCVHN
ncbi:MAG: DUF1566 domain-containing protein, partial [Deltaproteobacteria bacterium]|nr:DUF1566 domain-containing protein [Deltaproteobacteria bacterium]